MPSEIYFELYIQFYYYEKQIIQHYHHYSVGPMKQLDISSTHIAYLR